MFVQRGQSQSPITSARLQCWALLLVAYDYTFQHKPGTHIANADALSCLSLPQSIPPAQVPQEIVLALSFLDTLLVLARQIKLWA